MRISVNSSIDANIAPKAIGTGTNVVQSAQGSKTFNDKPRVATEKVHSSLELEYKEDTKAKVIEAVNTMNEMLEVNNNTSKFMFHEGLERYYVTVVDRDTEEVVKEIPPKKLLDAFYEMQKMLGMIVDEKI